MLKHPLLSNFGNQNLILINLSQPVSASFSAYFEDTQKRHINNNKV